MADGIKSLQKKGVGNRWPVSDIRISPERLHARSTVSEFYGECPETFKNQDMFLIGKLSTRNFL
jgi:hypothetical protein